MSKFAWVTLATNDSYSLGALVLAYSLKRVKTNHTLAVLITPGVTQSMKEKLQTVFNIVEEVNVLDSKDASNLALLSRPELGITFTKLHCWRLTQFEKCVFLDADTMVLQNCDELFEREELSAAPDVGWPDCFNSGVFVFRPSLDTHTKLTDFAIKKGSFDGGDQGLLNLFYADWAHKDISKHLPFIYNTCSTACYSYLPAFKQFGQNVKILHFIGQLKPWLVNFDPSSKTVQTPQEYHHLTEYLQLWWNLFCSEIHPKLSKDMSMQWTETVENQSNDQQHHQPNIGNEQNNWYENNPHIHHIFSNNYNIPESNQNTNNNDNIVFIDPWDDYYNRMKLNNQNRSDEEKIDESKFIMQHNSNEINQQQISNEHCENVQQYHSYNEQIQINETNVYIHQHIYNNQINDNELHQQNHNETISIVEQCNASSAINVDMLHQHQQDNSYHNDLISQSNSHLNPIPPNTDTTIKQLTSTTEYQLNSEINIITSDIETATSSSDHFEENGLAGALAQITLGSPRSAEQSAYEENMRRQAWEAGHVDYLGKDSFENIWKRISQSLGITNIDPPKRDRSPTPQPEDLAIQGRKEVLRLGPSLDEGDEDNFHEADLIIKGTQWKRELQEYHQQHRKTTDFHEEIITETTTDGRTIQKLVRTYPGEETETIEEYEAVEIDGKVTSVTHTVTGAENKQKSNQQKQIEKQQVKEEIVTEVTNDGRTIQKKIITYPGEVTETIEESEVTQIGDEVTEVKRQVTENKPETNTVVKPATVQSPLDPGKQEVIIVPGHQKVEFDAATNTKIVTEKTTTGYQQTITTVTAEGLTKTQIKTFFDAVEIPGEEIVEEETVTETSNTSTSTTQSQSSALATKNTQKNTIENVSSEQKNRKTDQVDTTNNKQIVIDNRNKAALATTNTTESASCTTTAVTKTTKESTKSEQSVRIVSSSGSEPITTATASETKVQSSDVSAKQQTKIKQKDGTEKIEEYEETQAKEVKISGQIKMTPTEAIQQCQKTVQLTESVTEKIDDEETTIINEKLETESQNQKIPLSQALTQNVLKAIEDTTTNVQTNKQLTEQEINKKTNKNIEQTKVAQDTNNKTTKTVSTNESNTTKVVIVSKIINDDGEEVTEEIRHFPGGREHITKTLRVDGTTKLASKTFYDAVPVEETTIEETTTTTTEQSTKNIKDTTKNSAVTTIDNTTKNELVWEQTHDNGDIETEEIRHFAGGREHITTLLHPDGTTKVSSKTFYDEVPVDETTTTEEEITTTTEQKKIAQNNQKTVAQKTDQQDTKTKIAQKTDKTQKTTVEKTVTDNTTKIELVWEQTHDNGDIETEEIRHFTGGREHITKVLHPDGTTKVSSKTFYDEVPVDEQTTTNTTDETTKVTKKVAENTTNESNTTKVVIVSKIINDDGEEVTEEIRHFPGGREHITKTLRVDGTTKMSSKTFYDSVPVKETTTTTEETETTTTEQRSKVAQNTKATEQISKVAQNTKAIEQVSKVAQNTKAIEQVSKVAQNTKAIEQVSKVAQITDKSAQKTIEQQTNKNTQNTTVDQKTSQNIKKSTENTTKIELVSTIKQKNGDVITEEIRHFPGGREHITKTLRVDGTTKMASKTFYDSVPVSQETKKTSEETKKSTNTSTAIKSDKKGIVSTTDTQIAATTTNTTKIELVSTVTNKDGETTTEHIRHFPGGQEHIFKTLRADGSTKCGSSKTVYDAVPVEGATGDDEEEEEIEEYEETIEEHSSSSVTKTENTQTTSSSSTDQKVDTQTTSTMSTSSKVDIETSAKKKLPFVPASKKTAPAAIKQKEAATPTPVPPPRKKEVKKSTKGK